MSLRPGSCRLVVFPADEGLRLDQFLASATSLSRRAARRLVEEGSVLRNGRPARIQGRPVTCGDAVDLIQPDEPLTVREPPAFAPPRILHEDRWLVVADKPAGVLSQPADSPIPSELAFDQILLLHLAQRDGRRPFLRLVHRLDRLTSGAVLFAHNPQAPPILARAWAAGQVDRRYLAVVEGRPAFDRTAVDLPIGRDPGHVWRFEVNQRGEPARTSLRVLDRGEGGNPAVLECRLVTGRTHQVRVHLAAIGHPVVGDRLYGARRSGVAERPLLHAVALALPHPHTGARLEILCPLPADILSVLGEGRAAGLLQALAGQPAQLDSHRLYSPQ